MPRVVENLSEETGLPQKTLDFIKATFKKYPAVTEVTIFGSRAKGNFRPGSDIDLSLMTTDDFTYLDMIHIMDDFEESYEPYMFDVLEFKNLTNENLKQHIQNVGIKIV